MAHTRAQVRDLLDPDAKETGGLQVVEDPKTGPYVKGAVDKVGPGLACRPHRAQPARTARSHARPSRLQLAALGVFGPQSRAKYIVRACRSSKTQTRRWRCSPTGSRNAISRRRTCAAAFCAGTGTLPTATPTLCPADGAAKEHSTPIPSRVVPRRRAALRWKAWLRMVHAGSAPHALRAGGRSGPALALQRLHCGCIVVVLWLYYGPCGAGTIIRRALMSSWCWCWRRAKKSRSPRWT
jgi:hypothetical protein